MYPTELPVRPKFQDWIADDPAERAADIVSAMTLEERLGQTLILRAGERYQGDAVKMLARGWAAGIEIGILEVRDTIPQAQRLVRELTADSKYPPIVETVRSAGTHGVHVRQGGYRFLFPDEIAARNQVGLGVRREYSCAVEMGRIGINRGGWVHADLVSGDQGAARVDGWAHRAAPMRVLEMARETLTGARQAGLALCGCHWLGFGKSGGEYDALPRVLTMAELKDDIAVWQLLWCAGLDAMMVTWSRLEIHARERRRRTFIPISAPCLAHLRGCGFGGLICSDSFEMPFTRHIHEIDAAKRALAAGCDIILPRHAADPRGMNPLELHAELCTIIRNGWLSEDRIADAARRSVAYRIRNRIAEKQGAAWQELNELRFAQIENLDDVLSTRGT